MGILVLDTNVISETLRVAADPNVITWLNHQTHEELWFTSISAAEMLYGAERLPVGKRQRLLMQAINNLLDHVFRERILNFDLAASRLLAKLAANREREGRTISPFDGQIAAICLHHQATLVTRNTKHFEGLGISLINPWHLTP